MKPSSLLALAGLAISFALPAFAQQDDKPDPQLRQRLIALIKIHTDAQDSNDAAAVAAVFTEDGVLLLQDGPIVGRKAIERFYAGVYGEVHFSNNLVTVDEDSPHIIGADGKHMWATGSWSATIKGKGLGSKRHQGILDSDS